MVRRYTAPPGCVPGMPGPSGAAPDRAVCDGRGHPGQGTGKMGTMPREPEAFAEVVATMLRKLHPDFAVDLIGPRELIVNGRRLDLDNLYRMVNHEPARGSDIVEHYLEQLFAGDALQVMSMSLDFARGRIMPRIQPDTIFRHLSRDQVAHVPYVNDTVIVFVTDLPQMTVSITTEQLVRWKICIEECEQIARHNLDDYAPELEVQFVESKERSEEHN